MISDKLQKQFNAISDILREVGEQVEGNLVCNVSSDNVIVQENEDKIHNLRYLIKNKSRVCLVGVNAGHSLLIMLEQNPTAEYVLFDLGNHGYTRPCVEYIKQQYPKTRINVIYGDSKETIPNFIIDNKYLLGTFDIVYIDGGRNALEYSSDFYNCRFLSNENTITIFNDYNFEHIAKFINNRDNGNLIKRYQNSNLKITNKHFIYTY